MASNIFIISFYLAENFISRVLQSLLKLLNMLDLVKKKTSSLSIVNYARNEWRQRGTEQNQDIPLIPSSW